MLARLSDGTPASRGVVCLIAAIILFIKIPGLFTHPEFWAEDSILISNAYNHGLYSLVETLGGTYLSAYGSIIALFAVQFPPVLWPWITAYAAHAAAILVVFMVTSPRFDFPHRGIAALAVIAAPVSDVFYGLANAQWILSIGLVVIPFCRPPESKASAISEILFVLIVGLTGPFAVFALPIYVWRAYKTRDRLITLSAILLICAATQLAFVANDRRIFDITKPAPYDPLLWLVIPTRWLDWIRIAGILAHFKLALSAIALLMVAVYAKLLIKTDRKEVAIALALFAVAVLYSGMFKFRHYLDMYGIDRYLFSGTVFTIWLLCLFADMKKSAFVYASFAILISWNVYRTADSSFVPASVPWKTASEAVGKSDARIAIAPNDLWRVSLLH